MLRAVMHEPRPGSEHDHRGRLGLWVTVPPPPGRIMILSGWIEPHDDSGLWIISRYLKPWMSHRVDFTDLRIVGFDPSRAHAVNQYIHHLADLAADPRRRLDLINPPDPIEPRVRELHAAWKIAPPRIWRSPAPPDDSHDSPSDPPA